MSMRFPRGRVVFWGAIFVCLLLSWVCIPPSSLRAADDEHQIAEGKFTADWQSLAQYQTPEWYRDAKFGIWAHWSAQCVPEQGDWYARKMYIQGDPDYEYQVEHYGHPSKVGFKDIDNLWHAENWDPQKLMQLYKRAGAKFFVALANHHDNFDCFDSKYQPWNSVNIGPHEDIVGTWAKVARENGLRFGVSVHASHAWGWFEVAQGSDKTGPLAGVPYDGKLTKADGKGTWWDGYDPQDLYCQNHVALKPMAWDWNRASGCSIPDAAYCTKFFNRTRDLIDKYHPDMVYFDDTVLPLYGVSDVGMKLAAHLYNSDMQWHGGQLEAVLCGKKLDEQQRHCLVWDIERGTSDRIEPLPWEADTCIGNWHYSLATYQKHSYKTPERVIGMLADIVSKNGSLLLSIPVKGDGTIDDDEVKFLQAMAAWMDINSECIFGTRPFTVFGEGPSSLPATTKSNLQFNESKAKPMGAQDIRFTTRGPILYAIAMGWPDDGKMKIETLADHAAAYPGEIGNVELLGCADKLAWTRQSDGLMINLPAQKPCDDAYVFKITPKP